MRSLTIRDLRLHWPAAEKALDTEEEIVITRDGKPVAKLVKFPNAKANRRRFDPKAHLRRMRKVLGTFPTMDAELMESRKDRGFE
jgi:antitoxin (DNA-binding transcriptional repressor) of toxin-antitoxin stability system